MILMQSTSYLRKFPMYVAGSDGTEPALNASVTVNLNKPGVVPWTTPSGGSIATVLGLGWYAILLSALDTSIEGDLAYHCTADGCDNWDFVDNIQSFPIPSFNETNALLQQLVGALVPPGR